MKGDLYIATDQKVYILVGPNQLSNIRITPYRSYHLLSDELILDFLSLLLKLFVDKFNRLRACILGLCFSIVNTIFP